MKPSTGMSPKIQGTHACPLGTPDLLHQPNRSPQPPNFMKRQEDIYEAEARNAAANIVVPRKRVDPGVMPHKKILAPQRDPGKQEERCPHFETDHDVKDSQPTVHARFLRGGASGTCYGLRFRQSCHDDSSMPFSGKSAGGAGSFLRRPGNRCSGCRPQ